MGHVMQWFTMHAILQDVQHFQLHKTDNVYIAIAAQVVTVSGSTSNPATDIPISL